MSMPNPRDIGAQVDVARLHTAAISNADNAAPQNGASADSQPVLGGDTTVQRHNSAIVQVDVVGTFAAAGTLDHTVVVEDADDDGAGSPGAFAVVDLTILAETALGRDAVPTALPTLTGGGTEDSHTRFDLELSRLRRHVRVVLTPTFSAADTAVVNVALVRGGSHLKPADTA